jgi:nitric oxide reductase NorD protein
LWVRKCLRQAAIEARLKYISPFWLTVDRQGGSDPPAIFSARHFALLHRPDLLPTVLLDWIRRLV